MPASPYTWFVHSGDPNTTVSFRVTGQNGVVTGPVSAVAPVVVTYVVPVITNAVLSGTYAARTAAVQLTWTAASVGVVSYVTQLSLDGGASWNSTSAFGSGTLTASVPAFNNTTPETPPYTASFRVVANLPGISIASAQVDVVVPA